VDRNLIEQMELVRQIASLGLSARNSAGLKVRQPLNKAYAYAGKNRSLDQDFVEIILDELNVKSFELVNNASDLVSYNILPDNKILGPRFGADFPKVRAALAKANALDIATAKINGLPINILIDNDSIQLEATDVLVETKPLESLVEAHDKLITVAIDTTITAELRSEGFAREIVRRVQAMRKEAGFDIADRINIYYQSEYDLDEAIRNWKDYIKTETLSIDLLAEQPPHNTFEKSHDIDGNKIDLGVKKISE
jgi:isoleucyl-tRNA synthetase